MYGVDILKNEMKTHTLITVSKNEMKTHGFFITFFKIEMKIAALFFDIIEASFGNFHNSKAATL